MEVVLHFLAKPSERFHGEVEGTMAMESNVLCESTQAIYFDSKSKIIENIEKKIGKLPNKTQNPAFERVTTFQIAVYSH